jgi:hypothetical protein
MARPYVGIRKIHTDQIKMALIVHLAKMDFVCHFSKVGLLAPALVIEIVILSFFPLHDAHRRPTHTPQHTTNISHFPHATKGNQELGASR